MSRGLKTAPGEQPVATEIRPAQIEQPGNLGVAQGFASMAADFGEVAGKVSQLADQAAAVAGQKAGEQRGLDPEFRPTHSLSIYAKAFDEAGLNVYKTEANSKMLADLNGVYEQHQGDPAGFQAAADAKRAAWLDGSLQDVRPELAVSFDKQMLTLHREAVRTQHDRMDAQNRAASETEITTRMRQIQQRAYGNGLDPAADQVLAGDVADLQGVMRRTGLNGAPLVAPEQAQKIVQNAKDEAMQARIMGTFDRLPGTDAKEAFIKQFQDDFANGQGAAAGMGVRNYEAMQHKLIAEMRQQRFLNNMQTREIAGRVQAARVELEKGFSPPPDELAALRAEASKIADPRLSKALDMAQRDYDWQAGARTQTPQELSTFVNSEANRLRTNGGQPEEVHRLDLAGRLLQNMHSGLKQDALGWAERVGYVRPAPLDFSDTDKLAASVQARMPQAEQVAQHYNQPAQYFTPDERRAIGTAIAQGGAQGLSVLGAIDQAGGDKARAMIQELVPGSPAIAALGAHVAETGVTQVALDAADGIALRKQKDAKGITPLPKAAETIEAARRELRGVLDKDPSSKAALVDLANAVYQVRAGRKGLDNFDANVWRQGMRELIGERQTPDGTTYGGIISQGSYYHPNPIVLPPYMKQSSWREAIDMLQPEDLHAAGLGAPVGGDGKPISMDRLKNGWLVQVGDGRFLVATGGAGAWPGSGLTPGTEGYIKRDDGKKPFVLDFKKLQPVLGARRPDLFLPRQ
jgi:hypothetical protein